MKEDCTDFYTLADLLGHYDCGELTMEEVITRWSHDLKSAEELLRELLEVIVKHHHQLRLVERKVTVLMSN